MKQCPQCGTQYSDATLSFCLQDGTPLVGSPQADTPTVVLGETATRVRVPVGDPDPAPRGQSQVTHVASPQPEKKRSNTALAVVLTIIGMLVVFGVIGLAAVAFLRNARQPAVTNVNIVPNANIASVNTNAIANAYQTPYTAPSPVWNSRPAPAATPPPPPPVLASYPATKRLVFAHGAYSTSFSGELNPGDTRSLVLGCRSGQSLSANVSSGGECVTVRGSGTSLRTTTNGGDNYVTLSNKCSSVAHFTVSISVI